MIDHIYILFLYAVGFSVSIVLAGRYAFHRDWNNFSTCLAISILFLFAILPLLHSGNWAMMIVGIER